MNRTSRRGLVSAGPALALTWALSSVAALCHATGETTTSASAAAVDLSLEELLKTEVVTVSRKSQPLQATAAAVFVITREDIERSGATSIPDALRLAPGVQVARLANHRWAVSARGFNGRFANKLLVLMDGRSIYSPLFSGVVWEVEDTLLEDVERIEVIRGPGASLWGANAVNGVINIITRKARDTQGNLVTAGVGTEERGFVAFRHGAQAADGHFRVWGKAYARDASTDADGQRGHDDARALRLGFRSDWQLSGDRRLTLSGSTYTGPANDRWNVPDVSAAQGFRPRDLNESGQGVHLLARHEWLLADGSEAALQAVIDHSDLKVESALRQRRTTLDLDYQYRTHIGERHDLVAGAGFRDSPDHIESSTIVSITPNSRRFRLFNLFVQDEIVLVPERWRMTLGARLEHNNLSGTDVQPNARLIWTPTPQQSLWTALSRAARTPSRAENDVGLDLFATPGSPATQGLPVLSRFTGTPGHNLSSETLKAFELGYREQLRPTLSLDMVAFYNRYDDLRSATISSRSLVLAAQPYILQNIATSNSTRAKSHGLEVVLDWQVLPWWRLQPIYSNLRVHGTSNVDDPVSVADAAGYASNSPRHQLSVRSSMSLGGRQQFDLWWRRVGSLGRADQPASRVPAYSSLDLRYAWRPTPALELSLVGQNLLQTRHAEFIPDLLPSAPMQIERGWYAKARWQY